MKSSGAKEVSRFSPSPKQEEFMEAVFSGEYNVITFGGAIRGGKTYAALGTLIFLCAAYPGSRWAVVRKTLETLKHTTIKSFYDKICPMGFIETQNKSDHWVRFKNGSEIMFFAENYENDKDLNRFKGLEVNGFVLEEVNELQEVTFRKAQERAGSHIIKDEDAKQPHPLILCTCNPSNNWFKTLMYDKWRADALPDNWKYIPSKITDNPHVPKEYLESLKQLPAYEYMKFVEGNWDVQERTGHEAYYAFNPDVHVTDLQYNSDLPLWISVDFNVVPHVTATVWQVAVIDGITELRCIKEYALENPRNKTKFIAEDFVKDFSDDPPPYVCYTGDPSGKKKDTRMEGGGNDYSILHNGISELRPRDLVIKRFPRIVSRLAFINDIFAGSIPSITIKFDRRCVGTIADLMNTKEDSDGSKKKEKKTDPKTGIKYETTCHFNDTIDYMVCSRFDKEYKKHSGKRRRLLSS